MTMVNSTMTSTPTNRNGVSLRKTNKPLMEKRRRARINDSLSQLKSLVIHSSKKDSSQFSKLEKADILELTVKHLRGLQAQQQQQQQLSSMPQGSNGNPSEVFMNGKYRAGFSECASEVIRYLDQSQGLNSETKSKVITHLANCLQLVSASTTPSVQIQPQHPNHHHHHQAQQQQLHKVVSQPISTSTPLPQQQLKPNNAAAILAAAAAAVNNCNTTASTTTQLSNGQIIQIVSNGNNVNSNNTHLQNNIPQHPAVVSVPQNTNMLGLNHASSSTLNVQGLMKQELSSSLSSSSSVTTAPNASMVSSQPGYVHYAQPLHIQIPAIVSPILVNKKQQPTFQRQQQSQQTQQGPKPFVNQPLDQTNTISTLSSSSSYPILPKEIVSCSANPTKPDHQRLSTSPPSLYPGHPKARAQKQLNFFSQEYEKVDNQFSSSRFEKNDLTPPPSSASSSSSESENTSPLNLSQSPPFPVYNKVHKRHHPYSYNTEDKLQNTNIFSNAKNPSNLLTENQNRLFKEEHNNTLKPSGHNPTSVIVDSRKCSDFNTGKYWSMMEDSRQCSIRPQNTPSPASSVGDERLWRPW